MFPLFVYNILSGIEEDGKLAGIKVSSVSILTVHVATFPYSPRDHSTGTGAVYSFDPVGSYEREACRGAGAAQSLLQPFLDNQVSFP